MIRHSFKSKVLLLVFILTIIVNYLSATGFLTGNSQKSLSDRYQTLLTPAPLAFSIWSGTSKKILALTHGFFERNTKSSIIMYFPLSLDVCLMIEVQFISGAFLYCIKVNP